MAAFDKLKKFADQAKEKAGPILTDAKEKAGPLANQAKEKAAELATKAAPIAAQGVDKASAGLDKATKGKYTDKITGVHDKVNSGITSAGEAAHKIASDEPTASEPPVTDTDVPPTGEGLPG